MEKLLHAPEESKYNSPWNIAADFNINMSLTIEGIAGMLQDYEMDYHTGMDTAYIAGQLYDYTSGYPFLVSRICKILDEQVAGSGDFPDRSAAWTTGGFQEAVKILLHESNTLFDDVRKKLEEYPELSEMIYALLFTGKSIAYNPDYLAMDIGIRFGFIQCAGEQIAVANRIFETRLYNYYLAEEMLGSSTYSASMSTKRRQRK